MNTIDPALPAFGAPSPSATSGDAELGSADYLTLMVAQIQNQDPFSPMENGQFVAELAQFSTVSGIEDLNQNFSTLAASISSDQTLQASGLIGRDVLLNQPTGYAEAGEGLGGAVDVPVQSGGVNGQAQAAPALARARVDSVSLDPQSAGLTLNFTGLDALPLSQVREIS